MTIERRLLLKTTIEPETGCWIWRAAKSKDGYGQIRINNTTQKAHRVIYELRFGAIPKGLCVCHSCDKPACINPDHLFIGSQAENIADMDFKGRRGKSRNKGTKHPLCKVADSSILEIRSAHGITGRELAKQYGLSPAQISRIRTGKRWSHI